MKKNIVFKAVALLSLALVIQSCSIIKTNDFAQRKYTKFNKGNDKVQLPASKVNPEEKSYATSIAQNHDVAVPENKISKEVASVSNEANFSEPVQTKMQKSAVSIVSISKKEIAKSAVTFAKRAVSDFKGHKNTTAVNGGDDQILLLILAILLPPLAVYLVAGLGTEFWIDLILTLLFWLPGMIYAIIVVLR